MGRPVKWHAAAQADLAARWEAGESAEVIAEAHRTTAGAIYVQAAKQGLAVRLATAPEGRRQRAEGADLLWLAVPRTTLEAAERWRVPRRRAATRLGRLRDRGQVVEVSRDDIGLSTWRALPGAEVSTRGRAANRDGAVVEGDQLQAQTATLDGYRGAIVAAWGEGLTWDELDRLAGLPPRTLRRCRGASPRAFTEGLGRALGALVEEVEAARAQLPRGSALTLPELAAAGWVASQSGGEPTEGMRLAMDLVGRLPSRRRSE